MMTPTRILPLLLILWGTILIGQPNSDNFTVTSHEYADPDHLHPVLSIASNAGHIQENIFFKLLDYDVNTLELVPMVATNRPVIKKLYKTGVNGVGMSLTYEIREEATWDDGQPVSGDDYVFTMKSIFNPHVESGHLRNRYYFITDIVVDSTNRKRFTIYTNDINFQAEDITGSLMLLPEHIFDEGLVMREYSFQTLQSDDFSAELIMDNNLYLYASSFKSEENLDKIQGCGPYRIANWDRGNEITLERKENWWGDKIQDNEIFAAYPQSLTYRIIPYFDAAVMALLDGDIDVMHNIKPSTFVELQNNNELAKGYNFYTPDQLLYYYVGFNLDNPILEDKKVRQAINHLVNREKIIDTLFYGLASETNSPIHPQKTYYNEDIDVANYDIEAAAKLLQRAGWKDNDGDGFLEKKIDGRLVPLEIEYKYNQENELRKNIGELLKVEAAKVGMDVVLVEREWEDLLKDTKNRDFDMFCLAWGHAEGADDMRANWHSASDTEYGSNRIAYHSTKTDKYIELIENTIDPEKRESYYEDVQNMIYNEYPYVFLFVPKDRIAVNKRISQVVVSPNRRGYCERRFRID